MHGGDTQPTIMEIKRKNPENASVSPQKGLLLKMSLVSGSGHPLRCRQNICAKTMPPPCRLLVHNDWEIYTGINTAGYYRGNMVSAFFPEKRSTSRRPTPTRVTVMLQG